MSTSGDTMITLGGTMSTSRDFQYIGGYHEYIGRGGDIMNTSGDV